jgi:putative transposase
LIVGQTVIGSDDFIGWIKDNFLTDDKDREAPAHRAIRSHRSKDDIAKILVEKTGKTIDQVRSEKGPLRQIAMDLLYRQAGLTNPEIGRIFGVDYSSVSQERKRLQLHLDKNKKLRALLASLEKDMTRLKK